MASKKQLAIGTCGKKLISDPGLKHFRPFLFSLAAVAERNLKKLTPGH